jgi:hypothetical protein
MIDNGECLAKGLPVIACVIEIVLGFGRARNELIQSRPGDRGTCHRAEFELKRVLLTVAVMSLGSMRILVK